MVSWADPARRPWLIVGLVSFLLILGAIALGPRFTPGLRPAAPPSEVPAPAEAEPAPPAQAPVQAPAEAPPAPGATPGGAPAGGLRQLLSGEVALKALPFLLGLFWLISAWLVDAEARRAFVVQEPWGERRTVAYSCLAVGCVFPLILAGLIFSAYGFVAFVIFIAARQSWAAGIQAGGLVLLTGALALLLRGMVARYMASRADRRAL